MVIVIKICDMPATTDLFSLYGMTQKQQIYNRFPSQKLNGIHKYSDKIM